MTGKPLPAEGLLRIDQILSVFPVSKSTWWAGVKNGRLPGMAGRPWG